MIFDEFQRLPTKSSVDLLYPLIAMFGDGSRRFIVQILSAREYYS